jgi:hypothetical protein
MRYLMVMAPAVAPSIVPVLHRRALRGGGVFAPATFAADWTCQDQADAKKLAGAALTSFETKCVTDAVGKKS